jgi:succinoglycan biosynthesis protein ExoA
MGHSFGSSRKSFRTQAEGPVDVINYAVFRRDLVLAAGGYDEELTRNQDNDLNQKLRTAGHVLWCTWKTQCTYFPKRNLNAMFRYAFTNGYWNAISLRKNPASMAVRHFVPLILVLSLIASTAIAATAIFVPGPLVLLLFLPLAVLLGMHLALGWVAALEVALRERSPGALCLPPIFLAFHCSYGYGTLSGLITQIREALLSRSRPESKPARCRD